jgi:DMSO/TMAO reductase YedYZ molybdopterin-dependent catalytic subunit
MEQKKYVTQAPENSETPLDALRTWVTPNRLFFVRNHFPIPAIDLDRWRLIVTGAVRQRREWTFRQLQELPEHTLFATVECAGNGRSFLHPAQPGVQWGAGAVGHAEWTGVPLRTLLQESGVEPGALEVLFQGADIGTESDHPQPMHFERSLPLDKALHPDTLLVYRMNGELLAPEHGFPLRLFVPGWYGVASVKWLQRIEVLTRPFGGYFQSVKYTVQRPAATGGTEKVVVGPMQVKSEFLRPRPGETLHLGGNRLTGVAWAGEEAVARVEVSTDGGTSWNAARLLGMQQPYSWTLWEYLWEADRPGTHTLLTRAVTASGAVQPAEHDPHNGGYLIHHSRPLAVEVAPRREAAAPFDALSLVYDMNAFAEENSRRRLDVELEFAVGEGI